MQLTCPASGGSPRPARTDGGIGTATRRRLHTPGLTHDGSVTPTARNRAGVVGVHFGPPSAGVRALVTLLAFDITLSIYAFVGLIMLIGIVKRNAILQIDFALDAQRNEGKPALQAITEGYLIRFPPIMMTTMAALFGGFGASAEARRLLGLAVVGGLLFSHLVTLYRTPVYYTYLEALVERARRRRRPVRAVASEPPDRPSAVS